MNILEVKNLSKVYGKGETAVKALDDVSFSVKKGEFVCIIGPSGSGKSTLLHLLGGVDRPTSGKVLIDQTDIYDLNETQLAIFRRRQIGLIYQFYNLIPILTVEENITLPMLLDEQKVDPNQFNKDCRHFRFEQSAFPPAKPAFRRSAATCIHWTSVNQQSRDYACR